MVEFPPKPPFPAAIKANPSILKEVDDRLTFDQNSDQWLFETDEGDKHTEYQYNFVLERWLPKVDNADGYYDNLNHSGAGIDEEEANKEELRKVKKQKLIEVKDEMNKLNSEMYASKGGRPNTGVYVSNLPDDVTKQDIVEAFSKYGVISEDFKTGEQRIKLYYENEKFKNEALVIYHNKESVELAIQMLDDSLLRVGDTKRIRVQPAEFQKESNSSVQEKRQLTAEEKKLLKKRKEQLQKRISNWDDEESGVLDDKAVQIKRKIWDKTVVIENMLHKSEYEENALVELDLTEDIQEECDKIGIGNSITKIAFYDIDEIVIVKFSNPQHSLKCIEAFNNRYFDGLKLNVRLYKGEKFKKTFQDKEEKEGNSS
ncbi:Piso0_000749 [Millerozyma farinosa CBS 7064]|uniref:Piso0_000749 protein n=1 Tax=Pichia sorbitophila (strain ATCC MYA-4447 / BCRC 22081 / CBS 7064 / NBRC 10061 / NRRL Y-12695) TaxID=559304 RepID=G8YPY5_PICSO|nr:Piso0_000749 [Millerozyma farinosa CBS 7064]